MSERQRRRKGTELGGGAGVEPANDSHPWRLQTPTSTHPPQNQDTYVAIEAVNAQQGHGFGGGCKDKRRDAQEHAERRGVPTRARPGSNNKGGSDSHIHQLGRFVHPHREAVLALGGYQQLLHRGAHRLHPGGRRKGGDQYPTSQCSPAPLPVGRSPTRPLTSAPRCRTPRPLPASCCSYNPQRKARERFKQK